MYKLSRFFVSDITAGENLLRNGFVPILRENGIADHGVLFAANGTCKTTLLSFILNVFCPYRRRFVQHLQSGGDKTLEQYLIPGRPAVVLLEMATVLPPTLFDATPVEYLVLGQILYRHRSAPDKTDQIYFIAQSADFFDLLRRQWDELLSREQPYKAIRDFMVPHIQQTTSKKEWTDNLERLGLDPWLLDRQIDFARTEGGIKDAFKFRSESEFLSFFLGCVAELDAAVTIREQISESLRKMKDRPRKNNQLRAARNLKEQITNFDGIAEHWRKAVDAIETWKAKVGEAAYILQNADHEAKRKLEVLNPFLEEAEKERRDAFFRVETAEADCLMIQRFQLIKAIEKAKADIQNTDNEITRFYAEDEAVKAAVYIAEIRKKKAEADIKKEALVQADTEIAPILRKAEGLAAQYYVRLDDDRCKVQEKIEALQEQKQAAEARRKDAEKFLDEALTQRKMFDKKSAGINADIRAAEDGQAALPMEPGELPVNTRDRLQNEIQEIKEHITNAQRQAMVLKEEIRIEESRWRQMQTKRSELEEKLNRARERMKTEARDRSFLLADPHLRRMAGTPDFEPTTAELVSRLDDAIARNRNRLDETRQNQLALENDLVRLSRSQTLTEDDQTRRLIHFYLQGGMSPGELKSFPEYLADLYESPEDIAAFIEADPARFTGIMAATGEVIRAVCDLPVPEWLHRPVVISTPCPPEEVSHVHQAVIRPRDSRVYSKDHLAEIRIRLQEQVNDLKQEIETETHVLREMEDISRNLHAYRQTYPDRSAVAVLADRVQETKDALAAVFREIETSEIQGNTLQERKNEQDHLLQTLSADLSRQTERLGQVEKWLDRFTDLEKWYREKEKNAIVLVKLEKEIASHDKTLNHIRESIFNFTVDIHKQEMELTILGDRAEDVLRPRDIILSAEDREKALTMDLRTLRKLYDAAIEDQRRVANALGIDTLEKELSVLQDTITFQENRFQNFRHKHPHDPVLAETWAARSTLDREDRKEILAREIEKHRGSKIRMESEIHYHKKEIGNFDKALSDRTQRGISPELTEADLADEDLDSLLHRVQSETAHCSETHTRLIDRCRELKAKIETLNQWHQRIQLGMAETRPFDPVWDNRSPRLPWPDPSGNFNDEDRIRGIQSLLDQVRDMIAAHQEDQQMLEKRRNKMGIAFDRLRAVLQTDTYIHHLPSVIDELMRHDTESLGTQARDLIRRCEDIARNIESDLEMSQKIVDNLVDMLLQRSREYHQKLQAAAQIKLPEDVFIYGGKSILRAGTRLDFAKHSHAFRQALENWLYELIQQDRIPEVNQRAGNGLGSELLYQLLGAATGKKDFGIRLLKCDDTGRNYEPVGKDLGSGGEALTIAVLLYSLLISMRKKRRNRTDDRLPAFLVLDNPLGVCNRSDFLDAQLKMASAMGLQCVYLTGINDRESLELFELRVAIRKGEKKLDIDNTIYDCLEITELNVEKPYGPHM